MDKEIMVLLATAVTIGFTHTIMGPDHYVPFIVLSKAGKWSLKKTFFITLLCGIGHILSSVVLGFIGVAMGIAVSKIVPIESYRGDIAAWMLIGFGLAYFIWGLKQAYQGKGHAHLIPLPHKHIDLPQEYTEEKHQHNHHHHENEPKINYTPWILFIIFAFGPCEPLIPLLMYPAAKGNMVDVAMVATVFGAVTVGTMLVIVMASAFGLSKINLKKVEKYSHALAGLAIFLSGAAIKFLGL